MAKIKLNKKTSELLITVVADKNEWKKKQENAFNNIASETTVKGFRKGNVPADIVKKHISQQEVLSSALAKMLDELVKEASNNIADDIMILDSPTYKVEKISDVELEVTFIYPVYPEIKLTNYKNLEIKYKETKFNDKAVDNEIKRIQKMQATLENKEGKITKGDTAVFDFKGTVDGELFEGGTSENYSLEIGSGQFIPGFEDQMIGLSSGEEKEIKVTFPDEYHSEELKGKKAIFAVKINEVKVQTLPELDENFVKSTGVKDIIKIDELKKYIEKIFREQELQKDRSNFQKEAFAKISEKTEIVVPMQLVAKEMENQKKEFEENMKKQGLSIQQYIEMTGVKEEALSSQFKTAAEERLKESLIFAEIAKAEKIELTDSDYEEEYIKLAKVYGQDEKSIKGVISKQQMQIPMTNDKVINTLIKYNK